MSNNVVKEKERTIGNYNLGKTIGEGTFGKVRLGVHSSTGEKVAIKILEKDKILEQADIERVAKEIQILKMLRHQHIIQLYEIIETPKELFLIMEYANGGELFDYIVTNTKIKEKEACKFFQSIIAGVEYIHKIGVVHRDLKPENLLLDSEQNIKIVDFGLSNTYRSTDLLKTACGSPCYAAPEMIAGKKYQGLLVDIWSCGIIMFAMICGYLPFEDPNTAQLYKKIISGEFQIPSFISEDAKDLLCRVLNTDPNKRYTIKEIRAHPWYKQLQSPNQLNDSKGIIVGVDPIRLDEQLIEQLKHLHNVDPVQCRKMVSNNRHNNITTLYYLIQQRNRRQGRNYTTPEIKVQEITKLTMDDSIETNQMPQAQQGVQQKQKQVDTWQDALLTLESPINKTADYFKQIITKNFRDQYKLESPTIKQTTAEESSKIKVNPLYQHLQREILVKPKVHIPQMKLQFNPITQAVNNSISSVGTNTTTTPLATARKFKEEHSIDDRKHPYTDRAIIDKPKLIDEGVNKQNYSILDISNKYLRNDKIKTEHVKNQYDFQNSEPYSMKSVSQHQELIVHGEIAKKNYQIPMLKMNQQQQNNNANKTQPSQFKTINMSYYVQNRANDNNYETPIQGNQTNRQSLLNQNDVKGNQNDGKGQHQQQTSQIINRIKVTSSQHKADTHSTHQAVKAVEPTKVHKGAFNLQCISSKQPKQLLDDLIAALDKFRINFDQKSRLELQCQSKESTKFEMGVYQLNKCEGVHLIKGRFLDGDHILYQMYSQNIIQSMNL